MFKLILTVERKNGLSFDELKEHYENIHAPLAWSWMKPYMTRYVRNYVTSIPGIYAAPYDCITEMWFHHRASFEACSKWAQSDDAQVLTHDEVLFIDRSSMRPHVIEEIEEVRQP